MKEMQIIKIQNDIQYIQTVQCLQVIEIGKT